jgi:hypothetical protein
VVGSANARTQITLANNATTTVQDVSLYDAGSIEGWVYIDAPTDIRFYVKAPFSKYGAAANYYISPSYVGDTPPAGYSMTITAAGLIQITLPSIASFTSAVINFALNAPAVGTNFPLSLNATNIVEDGSAFSVFGWNSGSTSPTLSASTPSFQRISGPSAATTVTLPSSGIKAGYQFRIYVDGATVTNYVALNASGGVEVDRIKGEGVIEVVSIQDTPTSNTHWKIVRIVDKGSWTPIMSSGTGSITSYTSAGKYTRVDSAVTLVGTYTITNNGTGATFGQMGGFPFTSGTHGASSAHRIAATSGNTCTMYMTGGGSSSANIWQYNNSYPWATNSQSDFAISFLLN